MNQRYHRYRNWLERFISSDKGQRFFNFAYSIGAAVVIWGALFKILHLPGGNFLLAVGMGTEVLMFILTAFDRPDLRQSGNGVMQGTSVTIVEENPLNIVRTAGEGMIAGTPKLDGRLAETSEEYCEELKSISRQLQNLSQTTGELNEASTALLESYRSLAGRADSMNVDSGDYADQVKTLNRNITSLNTIYEIQLKSISSQLDSIESVNAGIRSLRDNLSQINRVYENMLQAMTVNKA